MQKCYTRGCDVVDKSSVEAIFRVGRLGEMESLKALELNNHAMLWHGTCIANLLSILKRGLLIAPPGAPTTGHMFGKVYILHSAFLTYKLLHFLSP